MATSPPAQRLVLIGHGAKNDVEDALVRLGMLTGFRVVVIDHHPILSRQPDELLDDADIDLSRFEFQSSDSVVVLIHGEGDVDALWKIGRRAPRYVGVLASRTHAGGDIEELRKRGAPEEFVESIHIPAGTDLGAMTPPEIALSIITEIVSMKHDRQLPSKSLNRAK